MNAYRCIRIQLVQFCVAYLFSLFPCMCALWISHFLSMCYVCSVLHSFNCCRLHSLLWNITFVQLTIMHNVFNVITALQFSSYLLLIVYCIIHTANSSNTDLSLSFLRFLLPCTSSIVRLFKIALSIVPLTTVFWVRSTRTTFCLYIEHVQNKTKN